LNIKISCQNTNFDHSLTEKQVSEGLDFILGHFNDSIWPRTISTKLTEGRQITIYSKLEAMSYYKDSDYLDCRIGAYQYPHKNDNNFSTPTISFLMIDLDLSKSNFSMKLLDLAKVKTLSRIKDTFNLKHDYEPTTILCTGNGYHFYISAESERVLEDMSEFSKFKEPSKQFLRFAEYYLSNGKADSEHYHTVSFKNCLLRIPGSYNSKNMSQVSIVQKWNGGSKVQLGLLYDKFLAHLIDQESKIVIRPDNNKTHTVLLQNAESTYVIRKYHRLLRNKQSIDWIERLLRTPLPEYRKYCIWRILAPYFINVKHLSFDDSYGRIYQWLESCSQLRVLDFDSSTKINDSLNRAINMGYLPISLDNPLKEPKTLKTDNRELYNIINR
jgi:Primase X